MAIRGRPCYLASMGKRVLVVVVGQTRGAALTFELFKQNVIDRLGADLALCVGREDHPDLEDPFYANARYVWEFPEPADWAMQFDLYARGNWRPLLQLKD